MIDDPTFRRRDSPPGSNDHKFYQAPFAETVTDLGMNPSEISRTRGTEGFVIGEVASTPKDWPVVSPTENDTSYSKLSKKEQKKRDKAAKRQSGESTPAEEPAVPREIMTEPESYFEAPLSKKEQKKRDKAAKRQSSQADDATPLSEPSVAAEIVQEPESYFETPKKSKKSKGSSTYDDLVGESPRERTVSVPVDAFDDLQNGQDEWVDSSKKSKKKSKRDRYVHLETILSILSCIPCVLCMLGLVSFTRSIPFKISTLLTTSYLANDTNPQLDPRPSKMLMNWNARAARNPNVTVINMNLQRGQRHRPRFLLQVRNPKTSQVDEVANSTMNRLKLPSRLVAQLLRSQQ